MKHSIKKTLVFSLLASVMFGLLKQLQTDTKTIGGKDIIRCSSPKSLEEVVRCSSPRSLAIGINRLEKDLYKSLSTLRVQHQELIAQREAMQDLPEAKKPDEKESSEEKEQRSQRTALESHIEMVESSIRSLASGIEDEYLSIDRSIGKKHSADVEKMKNAAALFSRIKVYFVSTQYR